MPFIHKLNGKNGNKTLEKKENSNSVCTTSPATRITINFALHCTFTLAIDKIVIFPYLYSEIFQYFVQMLICIEILIHGNLWVDGLLSDRNSFDIYCIY